ncbi:MAG: large-conductance mechanosensitive channel protein MscL [Ruminococcaceae bacterium]|nr:large-conductance mechanosensitive channel protein MscL [Oscillospiraceae bacterium]
MWKEFKDFAFKGNIFDMAVGVIIGGAFGKIVTSLVNDIVMPAFGAVTSGMNFKEMKYVISAATETKPEAAILYGQFIQNVVDFLIIAFSIFMVIHLAGKFRKKEEVAPEPEEPKAPTQEELLAEIRDILKETAPTAETEAEQE